MKSKIIVSLGVKKVNTECGIIPKVVPDLMALNFSALCSIRNVSKKSGNSHSTHYCLVKKDLEWWRPASKKRLLVKNICKK